MILEPDAVDFTPVINFDGTITFIWGKYSDGSISSIQLDSNLSAWSWSDVKTIGSGLFSNSYSLDAIPLSNENYIILFPYDDNASINYIVVDGSNHSALMQVSAPFTDAEVNRYGSIEILDNGNFVIAYSPYMGPPLAYDLKFKIIDPSSDMGDQYEIISDVNVSTSNKNQDQSVLKSSENGFYLSFRDYQDVMLAEYDFDGNLIEGPFIVNNLPNTSQDFGQDLSDIAVNDNGVFVVYNDFNNEGANLFGSGSRDNWVDIEGATSNEYLISQSNHEVGDYIRLKVSYKDSSGQDIELYSNSTEIYDINNITNHLTDLHDINSVLKQINEKQQWR